MKNENANLDPGKQPLRRVVTSAIVIGGLGLTFLYGDVDIRISSRLDAVNQQSDGSAMDTSFTFELGSFESGFTPNAGNTDLWGSNWTAAPGGSGVAYTQTPLPLPNTGASSNFQGTATTLTSNGSPFTTSDQAYIWGFNDRGDSGTGEWILLTNPAWMYPSVVEGVPQPPGVDFQVQNPGTVALLGSVNPEFSTAGDAPHMITESVLLLPVPEPSVGLLAMGGLGIAFVRRRR